VPPHQRDELIQASGQGLATTRQEPRLAAGHRDHSFSEVRSVCACPDNREWQRFSSERSGYLYSRLPVEEVRDV
jgi:hypothetical protein